MLIAVQNAQADLRAGFTSARDMSSHGNGYADVEIRNAINQGRFDGPRYQVSTLGIVWGATPADPKQPDNPLASTVVRSVDAGARGRPRADCARRRLDQAVPDRRLLIRRRRQGALRVDVSDARPAGAHRRDASPRQEGGVPRPRRRGTEERDRRRLRHDRARLRPRSGTGQHDGGEGALLRSRRCSATSSRTWTTTTRRTPAASTG